jgi:hypothetical protein
MSQQKKKKSNYRTVGNLIWQSEFDEDGKPIQGKYKLDDKGRKTYAIKLSKNVKVTIDGVDMTGKTLYVARTEDSLNRKLQNGIIQQEEYDQKLEEHGPGGKFEYSQFEITAKLD